MWHDPERLWVTIADRLAAEVRASPGSADAHHGLVKVLYALGRQDDALREVRSALSIDQGASDAHRLLASILDEQGRRDEALVEMTEAVRLDPTSFDARYGLAKIMFGSGAARGGGGRGDGGAAAARELLGRIREARWKLAH